MQNTIYNNILAKSNNQQKMFGVLIDPDKQNVAELLKTVKLCNDQDVDFFFVGGSIITKGDFNQTCRLVKENTTKPVIIFPGSPDQISKYADAILFLSLISGRNPEFLIDIQLAATPILKKSNIEIVPTGYLLVNCGKPTTAIKVSNTPPIQYEDIELAANTALTGQYLGHKLIYIDGGSGADQPIAKEMIAKVKSHLNIPLIIGGGIKSAEAAETIFSTGADIIIVGNGAEENRLIIKDIASTRNKINNLNGNIG